MVRILKTIPLQTRERLDSAGSDIPRQRVRIDLSEYDQVVEARIRGQFRALSAALVRLHLWNATRNNYPAILAATSSTSYITFESADVSSAIRNGDDYELRTQSPTLAQGGFRDCHLLIVSERTDRLLGCGDTLGSQPIGCGSQYQGRTIGCGESIVSPVLEASTQVELYGEPAAAQGGGANWFTLPGCPIYLHEGARWSQGTISYQLEACGHLSVLSDVPQYTWEVALWDRDAGTIVPESVVTISHMQEDIVYRSATWSQLTSGQQYELRARLVGYTSGPAVELFLATVRLIIRQSGLVSITALYYPIPQAPRDNATPASLAEARGFGRWKPGDWNALATEDALEVTSAAKTAGGTFTHALRDRAAPATVHATATTDSTTLSRRRVAFSSALPTGAVEDLELQEAQTAGSGNLDRPAAWWIRTARLALLDAGIELSCRYAIEAQNQQRNLTCAYAIRPTLGVLLNATYALRASKPLDLAAAYTIDVPGRTRDLTSAYAIERVFTRDLSSQYRVDAARSIALSAAYLIDVPGAKLLLCAYAIRGVRTKDLASGYLTPAARTLTSGYQIDASKSLDRAAEYRIKATRTKDLTSAYLLDATRAREIAADYRIRRILSLDLGSGYRFRIFNAPFALNTAYAIKSALARDLAGAFQIRSPRTRDLSSVYGIDVTRTRDLSGAYQVDASKPRDLSSSYTVDVVRVLDLASGYRIEQVFSRDLAGGYAIEAQRARDLAALYAIERSGLIRELASRYAVRLGRSKDVSASYLVVARSHALFLTPTMARADFLCPTLATVTLLAPCVRSVTFRTPIARSGSG